MAGAGDRRHSRDRRRLAPGGTRTRGRRRGSAPRGSVRAAARHQFDFWLGDWDVRDPAGKLVGRNRITRVHGGCALEEQWSGNGGVTGSSLNAWDAERDRWHQTWVDNTGGLLQLTAAGRASAWC